MATFANVGMPLSLPPQFSSDHLQVNYCNPSCLNSQLECINRYRHRQYPALTIYSSDPNILKATDVPVRHYRKRGPLLRRHMMPNDNIASSLSDAYSQAQEDRVRYPSGWTPQANSPSVSPAETSNNGRPFWQDPVLIVVGLLVLATLDIVWKVLSRPQTRNTLADAPAWGREEESHVSVIESLFDLFWQPFKQSLVFCSQILKYAGESAITFVRMRLSPVRAAINNAQHHYLRYRIQYYLRFLLDPRFWIGLTLLLSLLQLFAPTPRSEGINVALPNWTARKEYGSNSHYTEEAPLLNMDDEIVTAYLHVPSTHWRSSISTPEKTSDHSQTTSMDAEPVQATGIEEDCESVTLETLAHITGVVPGRVDSDAPRQHESHEHGQRYSVEEGTVAFCNQCKQKHCCEFLV